MSKRFVVALTALLAGCASITIDAPKGDLTPAPAPVTVSVKVEVTKSVINPTFVITGGGAPVTLGNFTQTASGTQNLDIWSTTVSLAPGNYTLSASGTYQQWDGTIAPVSDTSTFKVQGATSVALALTPAGDFLVPRGASNTALSFSVTRSGATDPVTLSASSLPTGVTFAANPATIASGSTTATGSLSATATANGTSMAKFTATMGSASDAASRTVTVVPVAGNITWVAAPFLTGTGIAPLTSPDGKWKMTGSRTGASRVWTVHIAPASGTATPIDVPAAQWGGTGGSNIVGLAFCPSTTSATLSALILSDENEDPAATNTSHANPPAYRLKVIRFDGGAPVLESNTINGLFYLSAVQPKLGFSADCSIVGGWTIDMAGDGSRILTMFDIFNGLSAQFSYSDSSTSPATGLAKISGATITVTPPAGAAQTKPVP
jgi:hypothetical protein